MTPSKKHHYIPQFYLRGFTNGNGEYFLFDKLKNEIRKAKPISSFFENRRNTSGPKHLQTEGLEEVYARQDREAAIQIEKVRRATLAGFSLEPEILQRLKIFTALMYWRIPANDSKFESVVDELSFKDIRLKLVDKVTGRSLLTAELEQGLKTVDTFRKMYRLFIPLISSSKQYESTDYENWRVYFRKDKMHITGDNPIIIFDYVNFSSLNRELFFPLSSDRLFMHTAKPKPQSLPPLFSVEVDMLVLLQAKRFVCCPNKEYLEFLVNKLYPLCENDDHANELKHNVFNYFK